SKAIRFSVGEVIWKCDLTTLECVKTDVKDSAAPAVETAEDAKVAAGRRQERGQREDSDHSSGRSPDGKWTAFVKDHNLFIKSRDDQKEVRLSADGKEGLAYGRLSWAPDSRTLVAFLIESGER